MKILSSLMIILFCVASSNAQINNVNKLNKNRIPVKTVPELVVVPKRILSANLEKLGPKEVAELPAATFNRAALSKLRTSKHWEISANKMRDKDLYTVEYFGKYEARPQYIQVYPENKYYPRLDRGRPGFLPEWRYLILKFSPEMNKRYRMHIKLKPGDYRGKKIVTDTSGGDYSDPWFINDQYDEVMFDFMASSQTIKISPVIAGWESYYTIFEPLVIEKIQIDRVE